MVVRILDFLVHRKYGTVYGYTLTLLLDEKFVSLNTVGRMGYQKSVFYTDFKNVQLILVKSSPQKSFAQKTIFLGLFCKFTTLSIPIRCKLHQ
jgi:hypothetical protein